MTPEEMEVQLDAQKGVNTAIISALRFIVTHQALGTPPDLLGDYSMHFNAHRHDPLPTATLGVAGQETFSQSLDHVESAISDVAERRNNQLREGQNFTPPLPELHSEIQDLQGAVLGQQAALQFIAALLKSKFNAQQRREILSTLHELTGNVQLPASLSDTSKASYMDALEALAEALAS